MRVHTGAGADISAAVRAQADTIRTESRRESAMKLHLRLIRKQDLIEKALRADGWRLERQSADWFTAHHPLVGDESTARFRLNALGLLTSASLQIEFSSVTPLVGGRFRIMSRTILRQ